VTADEIIDLIRGRRDEALLKLGTLPDAKQRRGWAARSSALLELLQEIPGTPEALAVAARAQREGIDY